MDLRRFEDRKADHLRLALDPTNDAHGHEGLDRIRLRHEALPELDFKEISLKSSFWHYQAASPFFISSMTAGHVGGEALNLRLAKIAGERRWPMGVGSQRRELSDPQAAHEWKKLRGAAPGAFLMSNLGLSQLIRTPLDDVLGLVDSLEAGSMIIHLNPLQECLQPEGTPEFKGGLAAIAALVKKISVPVIIKETGCGISGTTAERLLHCGVAAIDVSGFGGTHWGRIEGARAKEQAVRLHSSAAETFSNWGLSTADSLMEVAGVVSVVQRAETWASGGIRNGLDAAKCLSLGAHKVGFAKAALSAALAGESELTAWMDQMEFELKIALFNTGSIDVDSLRGKKWQKI